MTKTQQKKLIAAVIGVLVLIAGLYQMSQDTALRGYIAPDSVNPYANIPEGYSLLNRVIDGDTFELKYGSDTYDVRIIGINAPESVDPRKGVECFGKEASQHLKEILNVPYVRLSADPSQLGEDKYGRWLRNVYKEDGTNVGEQMIRDGYAYEYTYSDAYLYQDEYQAAEREARMAKRGLWSPDTCNGNP